MLLLRIYEQWRGIFFLRERSSVVDRGGKLYVIFLFCVGSDYVVWCGLVLASGRQYLLPVLYRILVCLS